MPDNTKNNNNRKGNMPDFLGKMGGAMETATTNANSTGRFSI